MSDKRGGNPEGGPGMERRAFIKKMAVAGFAVPAVVTLADEGTAFARPRPPGPCRPTTNA